MASFTPVGVEAQVKGVGAYLADLGKMDKAQQGLGKSGGGIAQSFASVGGSVLKFGAIAGGAALLGVGALAAGVVALGGTALQEYAKFERLSSSVQALVARELAMGKEVETQRQVIAQLTAAEAQEIENLNMKIQEESLERQTQLAAIQEQKQRIIELTAAYGENGLNVIKAKAKLAEMEFELQKSDKATAEMTARISELTAKDGELVTITEKVRTGQMSMTEAMEQASPRAQDLLKWIQKLAVESPFDQEGVAMAFRTALAYGFTTEQAVDLTEAEIDFTAATGQGTEAMNQIALALGQMQAKGKVSGQELIQLTNAGVGVNQILEDMGFTLDDVSNGLVDADKFIEAVIADMNIFKGAAKDQSTTFSGLINSLEDLKAIGLREFFTGTFQAIQPYLIAFVDMLSDAAFEGGNLRKIGEIMGGVVSRGISSAVSIIKKLIVPVNNLISLFTEISNLFSTGGLAALFSNREIVTDFQVTTKESIFAQMWNKSVDWIISEISDLFSASGLAAIFAGRQIVADFQIITKESVFSEMWNKSLNWITEIGIPLAQEKLLALFQSIGIFIAEKWPLVLEQLNALAATFFDWVAVIYPQIPAILSGVVDAISAFLRDNWPTIQATLTEWSTLFWDWVQTAAAGAGAVLGAILAAIGVWATGEGGSSLVELGKVLGDMLFEGLMLVLENQTQLASIAMKLIAGIGIGIAAAVGLLVVIGGQIVAGILSGILKHLGIDLEPATFQELGAILTGIGDNIVTIAKIVGQRIIDGIMEGIRSMQQSLEQSLITSIGGAIDGVKSFLGIASPSTLFMSFGVSIVEGLIQGIQSVAGGVMEALMNLFGGGTAELEMPDLTGIATALQDGVAQSTILLEKLNQIQTLLLLLIEETLPVLTEVIAALSDLTIEYLDLITEKTLNLVSVLEKMTSSTIPALQAAVILLMNTWKTHLAVVTQMVIDLDAALINMANVTLVALQAAVTATFAEMAAKLTEVSGLLDEVTEKMGDVASAAQKVGTEIVKAMEDAASAFSSAEDAGRQLLKVLEEVVKKSEQLQAAMQDIADSTSSIIGGGGGGPSATSMMTSSMMSAGTMALASPTMNAPMVAASASPVIINVGDINNGMDLANLLNIIDRRVAGRLA